MPSIYEDAAPVARKEVLQLKDIKVAIATDEQIAKGRLKNPDFRPQAQMIVTWEPRSYELAGGKYGNSRTEYFQITGYGKGLSDEEIAEVRAHGWRGAGNTGKRFTIPNTLGECKEAWQLFMYHAKQVGLRVDVGADGNLTSPDIGADFEVGAGYVALPKRIETSPGSGKYRDSNPAKGEAGYNVYMRLPLQKVTDYVMPDPRPVIYVTNGDDDTVQAEAATTTAGGTGSNVTAELLAAAFVEAGIIGSSAADYDGMAKQVNVTNKFVGRAPVLASGEVQAAAQAGELLTYAVAKGAITVADDGTIVKVA